MTGAVTGAMTGLRRTVLLTVLCGQVASAVAGVLPWVGLAVAALLLVLAAAASARADEAQARLLRLASTGLALVGVVLVLPRATSAGDAREVLGPLLVGVSVLQAAVWRTRRDLQGGLGTGLGLLVLGASFAPDVLVGLPLLVGWAAALAAGVLAGRERQVALADVAAYVAEQVDLITRLDALGHDQQSERVRHAGHRGDDGAALAAFGQLGHEGPVDLQLGHRPPAAG